MFREVYSLIKWKCKVCGYARVGEEPPEKCYICSSPKEKFYDAAKKGKRDKSS